MFVCILLLVLFANIFIKNSLRGLLIYYPTLIFQSAETCLSEDQIDRRVAWIRGRRKKIGDIIMMFNLSLIASAVLYICYSKNSVFYINI